jgi:hypothetical protein
MYELEEVSENEGRSFAKEIGAIFKYTSAKNSIGIDDLFLNIGNKFIDPNYEETSKQTVIPAELTDRRETLRLTTGDKKKPAGGCCSKNN